MGEKKTHTLYVGSIKSNGNKGASAEINFSELDESVRKDGWSISCLKVQAPPGEVKPFEITFSAPEAPFPPHTIEHLKYPYYSTLQVEGVLKGGSPPPIQAEGQKIILTVRIQVNPWEVKQE